MVQNVQKIKTKRGEKESECGTTQLELIEVLAFVGILLAKRWWSHTAHEHERAHTFSFGVWHRACVSFGRVNLYLMLVTIMINKCIIHSYTGVKCTPSTQSTTRKKTPTQFAALAPPFPLPFSPALFASHVPSAAYHVQILQRREMAIRLAGRFALLGGGSRDREQCVNHLRRTLRTHNSQNTKCTTFCVYNKFVLITTVY